jgi:peptide-methionine (S)-S-oxide reductase
VWHTRVGYSGGTTPNPTYRNIGDHTECFEVDFDPETISYDDLLQIFWSSHSPTSPAFSRQYESLVLAHTEEQLVRARHSRDRIESVLNRPVVTRIELLDRFHPAEGYHQKYRLRSAPAIAREFGGFYPADADLVSSTAAARVNGYLDGAGTCAALEREADDLGLSSQSLEYLGSRCR